MFIYIQTLVCMAVKKIYHIMFIYNSHSHMHRFVLVHEKILETHNIAFFVIALVLHTDTQRATREHPLFASSTKRWLKNLIIPTKVSQ